jgi:peroxiredoxin
MKAQKLLLITLFAFFSVSVFAQLQPGDKAPEFKLKNIDNKWVSLSDYSNQKGIVVVFTCNHCPYAILYESRLVELQTKYKPLKFPVVAINPNDSTIVPADSFSKMITNAAEKGFNFPYLLDDKQLFQKFGATRTPHVYLLKNEGDHFTVAYIGAIDDNPQDAANVKDAYLSQAIDALLEGKTLSVTETKAIGCTIKFKK